MKLVRLTAGGALGEVKRALDAFGLPLMFAFERDGWEFTDLTMHERWEPCPHCVLLYASLDAQQLSLVQTEPDAPSPWVVENVPLPAAARTPLRILGPNGDRSYVMLSEPHPACEHHGGASPPTYGIANTVDEAAQAVLQLWQDNLLGVIRHSGPVVEPDEVPADSPLHTAQVSFVNPAFARYPWIDPLDYSFGSGDSPHTANVIATMEAAERFSSLRPPWCRGLLSRERDLAAPHVHLADLPHYSCEQLDRLPFRNPTQDDVLSWRELESLNGGSVFVPDDYVFCNLTDPSPHCDVTTNGCAARLDRDAARTFALLELVERDRTMRHWLSGRALSAVQPSTTPSPIRRLLEAVGREGYDALLLDCDSRPLTAVVIAVLRARSDEWPDVVIASAASTEPGTAMLKALMEAVSSLQVGRRSERRRGRVELDVEEVLTPPDHAIFYRSPARRKWLGHYREPDGWKTFDELVGIVTLPSSERDGISIANIAAPAGLTPYFLDVTAPSLRPLGIHVARCFAPEAVPLTFGPGGIPLEIPSAPLWAVADWASARPHPYA